MSPTPETIYNALAIVLIVLIAAATIVSYRRHSKEMRKLQEKADAARKAAEDRRAREAQRAVRGINAGLEAPPMSAFRNPLTEATDRVAHRRSVIAEMAAQRRDPWNAPRGYGSHAVSTAAPPAPTSAPQVVYVERSVDDGFSDALGNALGAAIGAGIGAAMARSEESSCSAPEPLVSGSGGDYGGGGADASWGGSDSSSSDSSATSGASDDNS